MNTQPSPSVRRVTWFIDGTAWRIELIAGRWSLSRYEPASEQWQRVGSCPNRQAAVEVAYGQDGVRDA